MRTKYGVSSVCWQGEEHLSMQRSRFAFGHVATWTSVWTSVPFSKNNVLMCSSDAPDWAIFVMMLITRCILFVTSQPPV